MVNKAKGRVLREEHDLLSALPFASLIEGGMEGKECQS
jgi:hypothetical protein